MTDQGKEINGKKIKGKAESGETRPDSSRTAKTGAVKGKAVQNRTGKTGSAASRTAKPGAAKEKTTKTGTAKSKPAKGRTAKTGTAKSKTAEGRTAKTGTAKSKTAEGRTAKNGTAKNKPVEGRTAKTGTAKSGTQGKPVTTEGKTAKKPVTEGSRITAGGSGKTPSGKKGNPNLRLVKNGDKPVKKSKEPPQVKGEHRLEKDRETDRHTYRQIDRQTYRQTYRDRADAGEWLRQHRSLVILAATLLAAAAVLAAVYYYIITTYTVTTVYVDGNVHYTNEEIMDMVMTGRYGNNSLYLAVKYRDKGVEGVPFVEKMDISILAPDKIRINVYEKALAGYVEYLGRYMYFDRDGIVVESSEMRTAGIPQVTGLKFDYVVLNEPLPVENDEIFAKILSITQLLTKYELAADKIFFDSAYELTLYFGGVRVTLGSSSEIDEKIMRLRYILPELEGKTGTLQMENYSEDTKNITFNQE